jgi:molecular chaperone GrpE (heat shock protein)
MRDESGLSLAKWPFFLADVLLLSTACFIYRQGPLPLGLGQISLVVLCVASGACLTILPFVLQYWMATRRLGGAHGGGYPEDQSRKLEHALAEVSEVAAQGRVLQEDAAKTAAGAKDAAERMAGEVRQLARLLEGVQGREKPRPEANVGNFEQSESDWAQVLVQVLDHVYALQVGALRSGQLNLIEQVDQFQDACRSAARRVGLTPFIAEPADPFDAQRHQWFDGKGAVPAQSTVVETIATGYTFRGRVLRPALVRLAKSPGAEAVEGEAKAT